jgi:ribose transport system permease protein
MLATLFGALTVTIVQNGLNLNAIPTSTQNIVIGAIIVLAVGIDMWRGELSHVVAWLVSPQRQTRSEEHERRKASQ